MGVIIELKEINNKIKNCIKCSLCNNNKNNKVIYGRSSEIRFEIPVDVMFIGEYSNEEEAKIGKPFIGKEGEMLKNWINLFDIDNYCITNVVKNKPVDNNNNKRLPTEEEIKACSEHLYNQIEYFKPKIIICLGDIAIHSLIADKDIKISEIIKHQKEFNYKEECDKKGIKTNMNNDTLIYTYWNPIYILRHMYLPWQDEITALSNKIFKKNTKSYAEFYKQAGVANMIKEQRLAESKVIDDKFLDLPLIGLHTEYSLLDYGGKLDDTIIYLRNHNSKYLGVSDLNTNSSFLKIFDYKEEKETETKKYKIGMRPLFGAEIDFQNIKFALYVINETGFRNLNKILTAVNLSQASPENPELLNKVNESLMNVEGLLLILLPDKFDAQFIENYKMIVSLFDENNIYIGYIPTQDIKTKVKFNNLITEFGEINKNNNKIIVYQNTNFDAPENYNLYLTVLAVKKKTKFSEIKNKSINITNYIKGKEDLINNNFLSPENYEIYKNNTISFVERLHFDIKKEHNLLPDIVYDYGDNLEINDNKISEYQKEFPELSKEEVVNRLSFINFVYNNRKNDLEISIKNYAKLKNISYEDSKKIYDKRINDELDIIFSRRFINYFLIVNDIINFCNKEGIVMGASRGSVAGSLVSFLLGITQTEPVYNGLFFERFMNEYRVELPDIDCDFEHGKRHLVVEYLVKKYGEEYVVHIGTFLTFKEKSLLNELGKALDVPVWVIDEINNLLIKRSSGDARQGDVINYTFEFFPELDKHRKKYPEFFDACSKLEGLKRTRGTHASGILILKEPYYHYFALAVKNEIITHFDYRELEWIGVTKFDILGVLTLDVISSVAKKNNIKINYLHPWNDERGLYDEPEVFSLIKNGETAGLFQLNTALNTNLSKLFVENFTDLIAINAICRPAQLRYHMPEKYISFKKTGELIDYGELTNKILDDYGFDKFGRLLLFQEQIMILFLKVANMYSTHANGAVKAISKSKGISTFFEQYSKLFIDGAKKNGMSEEDATQLFKQIFQFGSFSFNLSHALGYAYLIYYTLWLKYHFKMDYYASAITLMSDDNQNNLISEILRNKIKLIIPDWNLSEASECVNDKENNRLILPLNLIKYLTKKHIKSIIENRPYNSFQELITKNKIKEGTRAYQQLEVISKINSISNIEDLIVNLDKLSGFIGVYIFEKNKHQIRDYIEKKYNIKTIKYDEVPKTKDKKGYVIFKMKRIKYSLIGDWMPKTSPPTEEEIKAEPEKYSFLKRWNWMDKFCKIECRDLMNNDDAYLSLYPEYFKTFKDKVINMKSGSLFIAKVDKSRARSVRAEINDFILIE